MRFFSKPNLPHPIYPGYPFILILYAIREFDSIEDAIKESEFNGHKLGFSQLTGNINIPGAGDSASEATKILSKVHRGELRIEDIPNYSDDRWFHMSSNYDNIHFDKYESGLKQAKECQDKFWVELAKKWGWEIK